MWRVVTVGPACGKATLPLEFREAAALEGEEIEVWDFMGGAWSPSLERALLLRLALHATAEPVVLVLAVDLGSPHGVARSLQSWLSVIASTVGGEGVRRILLVGTRWDALLALQLGEAHLEATEQQLRSVAATSGAELLYTAAASDADVAGVIGRLRSLLSEPAQRLGRPEPQLHADAPLAIPVGLDRDGCASTGLLSALSPARTDVPVAAATTRRTRLDDEAPFAQQLQRDLAPQISLGAADFADEKLPAGPKDAVDGAARLAGSVVDPRLVEAYFNSLLHGPNTSGEHRALREKVRGHLG